MHSAALTATLRSRPIDRIKYDVANFLNHGFFEYLLDETARRDSIAVVGYRRNLDLK
jgi:hypothetical protein